MTEQPHDMAMTPTPEEGYTTRALRPELQHHHLGEEVVHYLAFQDYLEMGHNRSYAGLLRIWQARETKNPRWQAPTHSKSTISDWATRFDWYKRARLYEAEALHRRIHLREERANMVEDMEWTDAQQELTVQRQAVMRAKHLQKLEEWTEEVDGQKVVHVIHGIDARALLDLTKAGEIIYNRLRRVAGLPETISHIKGEITATNFSINVSLPSPNAAPPPLITAPAPAALGEGNTGHEAFRPPTPDQIEGLMAALQAEIIAEAERNRVPAETDDD